MDNKKISKNMIRGSWFGHAEILLTGLANTVVGVELVTEFNNAFDGLAGLYDNADDLDLLISGLAPNHGIDTADLPRQERFCNAIQAIKDKAKEQGLPLQVGVLDDGDDLRPAWYVDVHSPETEVFEIKLTPFGRKIRDLVGKSSIAFSTDILECY